MRPAADPKRENISVAHLLLRLCTARLRIETPDLDVDSRRGTSAQRVAGAQVINQGPTDPQDTKGPPAVPACLPALQEVSDTILQISVI